VKYEPNTSKIMKKFSQSMPRGSDKIYPVTGEKCLKIDKK